MLETLDTAAAKPSDHRSDRVASPEPPTTPPVVAGESAVDDSVDDTGEDGSSAANSGRPPAAAKRSAGRNAGRLLVVDDDEATCELLAATLGGAGFEVVWEASATAAMDQLRSGTFDAMLTDLHMAGMDGLQLCRAASDVQPGLPVIVVTGNTDLEAAIGAMRAGAYDFITKPVDTKLLAHQVQRAVGVHDLHNKVTRLERELAKATRTGPLVGQSRAMRDVFDLVGRVADSDANVLVTGESGTGKELVARAIHDASSRSSRPFVAINCAAVPATLIESELFGHVKGAFTDARRDREGLFVQAEGGTVFLDEIGELPLEMQPKLLRALQERRVRPVGGDAEVPFDVRIVTATNRDLEAEVAAGRFREDLLYRIDVVRVELPALRARGNDVLLLAQHFLEKHAAAGRQVTRISEGAAEKLLAYDWPGNVRELENSIERAVALSRLDTLSVEDLPRKIVEFRPSNVSAAVDDGTELLSLEELENRYVRKVLALVGGNKTRAAQILGIDRRSLYRRLERVSS
jgi:two-component system response regulator HydG